MQNSRSQAKHDLSAALALEVTQWQKAGNTIKVLPACQYAHQLYCVQGGSQQSEGGQMRVGTFVPPVRVDKPLVKAWVLDDYQRAEVNAKQREVYAEWVAKGLTLKEAEKIANREKMRLFYALRRTRETD
jgi:hypothetical protein